MKPPSRASTGRSLRQRAATSLREGRELRLVSQRQRRAGGCDLLRRRILRSTGRRRSARRRARHAASAARSRGPPRRSDRRMRARSRSLARFRASRANSRRSEASRKNATASSRASISAASREGRPMRGRQQARAGRGDRAVDGRDQRSLPPAARGALDLEASARGRIDGEEGLRRGAQRRIEARLPARLRQREIVEQQGAGDQLGARERSEAVERRDAIGRLDQPLAELRVGAHVRPRRDASGPAWRARHRHAPARCRRPAPRAAPTAREHIFQRGRREPEHLEGGRWKRPPAPAPPRALLRQCRWRRGNWRTRASSSPSSVIVPGVTTRTISRRTTALEPRFFASAGSSICSQTATRKPCLISRAR